MQISTVTTHKLFTWQLKNSLANHHTVVIL